MPQGAWSKKREREYEELVDEFKKEDRYEGREEEVAARIVNKQRAQYGETKEARRKDREGKSPDRNLPIDDYQQKTVDEIKGRLDDLSQKQLKQIRSYEQEHKHRKTLMEAIDKQLSSEK